MVVSIAHTAKAGSLLTGAEYVAGGHVTTDYAKTTLTVGPNATAFIADADIPRVGAAMIADDGNSGAALIQWYRSGTFNSLNGVQTGNGNLEFRNTTFSGGGTGFSFFIESNSAGGRLGVKNNNGFGRTFTVFVFHGL